MRSVFHSLTLYFFLCFCLCWAFLAACRLSPVAASGGYSLIEVHRLLTAAASRCGLRALGSWAL